MLICTVFLFLCTVFLFYFFYILMITNFISPLHWIIYRTIIYRMRQFFILLVVPLHLTYIGSISLAASQSANTRQEHVLYEQSMESHQHCRAQLDIFIDKSSVLLEAEPIEITNERNLMDGEGSYSYLMRPNDSEIMTFKCRNNLLTVSYTFL